MPRLSGAFVALASEGVGIIPFTSVKLPLSRRRLDTLPVSRLVHPVVCGTERLARHAPGRREFGIRSALFLPIVLGGALADCGSNSPRQPPAATPTGQHQTTPDRVSLEARWIARPDAPFVRVVGTSSAASWLLTAGTQRLELTANGELRAARQWLAHSNYTVTELAPRLGGGFLFTRRGEETVIERASTYLAPLQPVARLSLRVSEVVQGLDRLYAVLDRTRGIVALDLHGTGAFTSGPLPEAPAYGPMAFADEWFGVVTVPFQGGLATFDAGATWHQLGFSGIRSARIGEDGILIDHGDGTSRLQADGTVAFERSAATALDAPSRKGTSGQGGTPNDDDHDDEHQQTTPPENEMRAVLARQMGERLAGVALRGWPLGEGHALLLENGSLLRVDLETAELVERREHLAPTDATCHAARLFTGAGFICHTARETLLYQASTSPLDALLVHRFRTPRVVSAAGTGGAVVSGPCRTAPRSRDAHSWCVVPKTGTPWQLSLRSFGAMTRVVALADGNAAIIAPPKDGWKGSLTIVTPDGTARHRSVLKRAPASPEGSEATLRTGLWLEGFTQRGDGALSGWLATDEALTGVLVRQDGSVEVGRPQATTMTALFAAESALAFGDEGQAWQTGDGGQSWQAVPVPKMDDPGSIKSDPLLKTRGCGPVGCVINGWVRIGWRVAKSTNDLPTAEDAPPTPLPMAGGGRWVLDCAARHHVSRRGRDGGPASDWQGFFGLGAPRVEPGERRHSHAQRSEAMTLQGYAWGPGEGSWRPGGRWVVRALSGYDPLVDAWSTSTTVCPWPDESASGEAFGRERRSGPPAAWSMHADPGGRGGLLRIGSVSDAETYLAEASRPLVRVRGESVTGSFGLLGAVRTDGSWFALSPVGSGVVALSRLESGVAKEVMRLRDDTGASRPVLVRNRAETALGLWVQDAKTRGAATRWFVYAVDLERGEAGEVLVVDDDVLGHSPRPCVDEDSGWVLEGPMPLGPSLDLGTGESRSTEPHSVRARVVVGEQGLCVEGLMGVTSAKLALRHQSSRTVGELSRAPGGIPLVLRDQDGEGDHWVFECLR